MNSDSNAPLQAFPELMGYGSQLHNLYFSHGKLWMGLNGDAAVRAEKWLDSEIATSMVERGLMPSMSIVSDVLPGCELCVGIDSGFVPVRPDERSISMLKQGAANILELARHLDSAGWSINHLEAGQFGLDNNGRSVFIGLPAIVEKSNQKFPFADFASLFLCPLELVARHRGLAQLSRRTKNLTMAEYRQLTAPRISKWFEWAGLSQLINQSPFGGLYHTNQFWQLARFGWRERKIRQRTGKPGDAPWTNRLIRVLQKRVAEMDVTGVTEKWSTYHQSHDIRAMCGAHEDWRDHCGGPHPEQIIDVLEQAPDGTLLDLGANQGFYSIIAAHLGYRVTALDTDSGAIDHLYAALKNTKFPLQIRPAVVDFVRLNPDERSRFISDVVLALGFTHHMRLDQELSWPIIAEVLAGLTNQLLITEFKTDTRARSSRGALDSHAANDYKIDHFLAALQLHFDDVQLGELTRKSPEGGGRQLILCTGKKEKFATSR